MRRLISPPGVHYVADEFDPTTTTGEKRIAHLSPLDEAAMSKTAYRISDLPVGKTKAYEEIRAGRLRALKCGRRTIILPDDYERWLKSLPTITPGQSDTETEHEAVSGTGRTKSQPRNHKDNDHSAGHDGARRNARG